MAVKGRGQLVRSLHSRGIIVRTLGGVEAEVEVGVGDEIHGRRGRVMENRAERAQCTERRKEKKAKRK